MAYIGRPAPEFLFDAFVKNTFDGDGSTTDFTLSKSPASPNSLLVLVDNVVQEPGVAFTLSDNTLTLTEAPDTGSDNIYAVFWGGTLTITETSTVKTANSATITGNLVPTSNVVFSLGEPASAWKELYLDANSLHLGNTSVSIGKTGEVEFMKTNKLGQPVTNRDIANVHASIDAGGVLSFYSANTTGNVRFARGTAIGYANSKVPGANLDVHGNAYISGATTIAGAATLSSTADVTGKLSATSVTPAFYGANVTGNVSATRSVAVGYTDGRVPQANLEVRGNVFIVPGNPPARATATPVSVTNTGNVGIGISGPTVQVSISNSAAATIHALTDAAEIALDFGAGQNFSVTLGGNRTLKNPVGIVPGQCGSIFVKQDGTGSRTLAYQNFWLFKDGTAPTLTTSANANDRIDYITISSTAIQAVATTALNPS